MKVFVAGATGALGKQLVPRLVAGGHEVVGMTRSAERARLVQELGAEPAIADALDPDAVGAAVSAARPEVIVHQLTALAGSLDLRHFEREFAQTNRLRTEGTDILLSAARAVGARRFVAQSFAGWPAERTGGPIKTEDDPLDSDPPEAVPATSWGDGRDLRTWSHPAAGGLAWMQRAAELRALTAHLRPSDRALRELIALQSSDWAFLIAAGTAGPYPRERADGHLAALDEALADPSMDPSLRHLAPWI